MSAHTIKERLVPVLVAIMIMPPVLAESAETGEMTGGKATTCLESDQGGDATPAQLLGAEELKALHFRAEHPGEDVAGGALTNQQLTYIVIALAAAVVVLILV